MIDGLIDYRNSALFEELKNNYEIKIELVDHTHEYGCYSIENTSTIYIPESNICADSFTHELLHIYLRSKEIFIGARLTRIIKSSAILPKIYSSQLLEHIGNCLDHIKMFPIYLNLGLDRRKFLSDFENRKCTIQEAEQIKRFWKLGSSFKALTIDFYLRKYFAIKACPNENFDYKYILKELRHIDESLFSINEKLINRWTEMKIDSRDSSEDDYKMIAGDYINEMEEWVELKTIK